MYPRAFVAFTFARFSRSTSMASSSPFSKAHRNVLAYWIPLSTLSFNHSVTVVVHSDSGRAWGLALVSGKGAWILLCHHGEENARGGVVVFLHSHPGPNYSMIYQIRPITSPYLSISPLRRNYRWSSQKQPYSTKMLISSLGVIVWSQSRFLHTRLFPMSYSKDVESLGWSKGRSRSKWSKIQSRRD